VFYFLLFLLSAEERKLTDIGCFLFEIMLSVEDRESVCSRSVPHWGSAYST
jgi:hypothetical protein